MPFLPPNQQRQSTEGNRRIKRVDIFLELAPVRKKMGKRRLAHFLPNVVQLCLHRKNIFPFSHVEWFGYVDVPNEGTIKFLADDDSVA